MSNMMSKINQYEMVSKFIAQLHEHGFLVFMDDVGSGASSLNMLRDFPVDVFKIDKWFLDETEDNKRQCIFFVTFFVWYLTE